MSDVKLNSINNPTGQTCIIISIINSSLSFSPTFSDQILTFWPPFIALKWNHFSQFDTGHTWVHIPITSNYLPSIVFLTLIFHLCVHIQNPISIHPMDYYISQIKLQDTHLIWISIFNISKS